MNGFKSHSLSAVERFVLIPYMITILFNTFSAVINLLLDISFTRAKDLRC